MEIGLVQLSVMIGLVVFVLSIILSLHCWKKFKLLSKILFSPHIQISLFLGVITAMGFYFYKIGISRNYSSDEVATLIGLLAIMLISLKTNGKSN